MLPNLSKLVTTETYKKQRYVRPDCPKELRYRDGEILNVSRSNRVSGSSSSFYKEIPYDPGEDGIPETVKEAIDLVTRLPLNQTAIAVLNELYRKPRESGDIPEAPRYENDAVREVENNNYQPQYYLKTLETATTVVHIIKDGGFWSYAAKKVSGPIPNEKDVAFTGGFVWTNTSPQWSWKSDDVFQGNRLIRCRIHLNAGTQVLVDRSPVYGGVDCKFDSEGQVSRFPDVLLPPGKFTVTEVIRYQSNELSAAKKERLAAPEKKGNTAKIVEIEPNDTMAKPTDDLEYARARVFDRDEFVDVHLELETAMRFPQASTFE